MQAASEDRRMTKAHLKVQMGGIAAATEAYRASATPNVVIIDSDGHGDELLNGLDTLAEVCDAGTRVIAVGHLNDIILYRERRGLPAATTASEWENVSAQRLANIKAALELCGPEGQARITDKEAQRIYGHIVALQNAEVPLKRVEVKTE